MGNPVVIAQIGLAITAVAAGAQVAAQRSQARNRKRMALRNQQLAEARAADAVARAAAEESRHNLKVSRLLGRQRAAVGGSGAAVDVGTPLTILEDTAFIAELDTLTIRNNAAREAYGLETLGANFGFEAAVAKNEGAFGQADSILTGSSDFFGQVSTAKAAGLDLF